MKILSLRLKNLNSLSGEWKIDFTAPQYESDGIFLISGPTGSGKTTILDAICLALYGRTPRQKSFSNNINEIMPGDQRESMAEVSFEAGGMCYRSMWTHERTGGRAKDPFKTPQFYLENADTGQSLGKGDDGKKQIEKIIGMNFEQFTRSMLLAQGNFASFLQSSPTKRAELLEQITGTEIYSLISTKVFEMEKEKALEIKLRKEEIEGIEILDEKALSELQEKIAEAERKENECRRSLEILNVHREWKKLLLKLEEEMACIIEEERRLNAEDKAFAEGRKKLAWAESADRLEAQWALLASVRKDLREQKDKCDRGEKALPELADLLEMAVENLHSATRAREDAEKLFNTSSQMLMRAQSMDSLIREKEKTLHTREEDEKKLKERLEANMSERLKLGQSLVKEEKAALFLDKWLDANANNANIAQILPLLERDKHESAGFEEEIKNLEHGLEVWRKECLSLESSLGETCGKLDKHALAQREIEEKKAGLAAKKGKILGQDKLDDLYKSLENLRKEKERRLLLNREDVQDLRAALVENTPCPVCGALHHPYAEGLIPVLGEMEREVGALMSRIREAEEIERKINEVEKKVSNFEMDKKDLEGEKIRIGIQLDTARNEVRKHEEDIKKRRDRLNLLQSGRAKILDAFGLDGAMEPARAVAELKARMEEWSEKLGLREQVRNSIRDLKSSLDLCTAKEAQMAETLVKLGVECADLREEYEKSVRERKREYGELNADKVRELENQAVKAKKSEEEAAREERKADGNYLSCKTKLASQQEGLAKLEKDVELRTADFNHALMGENFPDESVFLAARLERSERGELLDRDRLLREGKIQLKTRKDDKEKELITEKKRELTRESLEELEERGNKLNDCLKERASELDKLKSTLQLNEEYIRKAGSKKEELELLLKDHAIYAELNELIGQKSGDKFRQFAQGLTLEILVAHANRELKKMSDRYLLVIDKKKSLELSISDNYKAGERRATSNLSGGESFIVSLALALGLASLSSKKTQVDSLFLDEGFGTLDEKSLETILNTLVNLKHEGKLIGLISHVGLFKERLNTVIELEGRGGKSSISGPGCSRV